MNKPATKETVLPREITHFVNGKEVSGSSGRTYRGDGCDSHGAVRTSAPTRAATSATRSVPER